MGSLPLAIVLHSRFSTIPASAGIAILAIALTCYGLVELSPSPFGGEGNRLLLAMQTDVPATSLLSGKILGLLLFNLLQAWAIVTIVSIGTGAELSTWFVALALTTVTVGGLCIALTGISTSDIDLERRVEDRTEALLAEHVPIGIMRMLGLGITGLTAACSIAILLRTSPGIALPLLCLLHAGFAIVMWQFARHRLTMIR